MGMRTKWSAQGEREQGVFLVVPEGKQVERRCIQSGLAACAGVVVVISRGGGQSPLSSFGGCQTCRGTPPALGTGFPKLSPASASCAASICTLTLTGRIAIIVAIQIVRLYWS